MDELQLFFRYTDKPQLLQRGGSVAITKSQVFFECGVCAATARTVITKTKRVSYPSGPTWYVIRHLAH